MPRVFFAGICRLRVEGISQAKHMLSDGIMEKMIRLHIEKLPEGVFLATSDDVQGLVAQGRTIAETLEIARDVAKKLMEAQDPESAYAHLPRPGDSLDLPILVGV